MSKADALCEEIVDASKDLYAAEEEVPPAELPDIIMFILTFLADRLGVCPLTPEQAQAEARKDSFWVRYNKAKAARAVKREFGIPSGRARELSELAVSIPADKDQDEWNSLFNETKVNTVDYGEI